MPYGLYMSADGADVQARRLEVIANNLANVDTVGFKRDVASFQAAYAEAIEQGILTRRKLQSMAKRPSLMRGIFFRCCVAELFG